MNRKSLLLQPVTGHRTASGSQRPLVLYGEDGAWTAGNRNGACRPLSFSAVIERQVVSFTPVRGWLAAEEILVLSWVC